MRNINAKMKNGATPTHAPKLDNAALGRATTGAIALIRHDFRRACGECYAGAPRHFGAGRTVCSNYLVDKLLGNSCANNRVPLFGDNFLGGGLFGQRRELRLGVAFGRRQRR